MNTFTKIQIMGFLIFLLFFNFRNAGFDPTVIRVDPYGNVLYYHADSASPLAWDIDHWFPCSSIQLDHNYTSVSLFSLCLSYLLVFRLKLQGEG